jgi:UPF0755 protein
LVFWLWVRTVLGAAVVYATWPLLAVVWVAGKFVKSPKRWLLLVALLVAAPLLTVAYWFLFSTGTASQPMTLGVHPGMSFAAFAARLKEEGITEHATLLRLAARLSGTDGKLHVGLYEVSPHDSPLAILLKLSRHEQVYLQFTFVEGCTLALCLPQVAAAVNLPADSLWRQVRSQSWPARPGSVREPAEGYLFPETYRVPWGADAATVIGVLSDEFETVWTRVSAGYSGSLSKHQVVTLASLIEAEAKDGNERSLISSVFHNRLARKMRLQCDPTVIYAKGGLDRPLLRKDWEFDSPYNTYLVAGLPPGPICAPGEASLRAALFPEQTDYLYFMARGDGTHQFSRTMQEHEAAYRQTKMGNRGS